MKKYLVSILLSILGFFGLTVGVNAASAPSTIDTLNVTRLEEYISGIKVDYKPIAGGLEVFCEDSGLTYVTGITYKLQGQVKDGYIYIFENRPNTGNKYKDYYIQNVAIWWYKDHINGKNTNIPGAKKNYIIDHRNSDEVCRLIYNLVEGAINYKQTKGSITFSPSNVTFHENKGYYISDKITITSKGLTGLGRIDLVGAPTNSTFINSTVNKTGNGTFQIQVPASSINDGQTVTFKVTAEGKYAVKKMYDYHLEKSANNTEEYQQVLYGKVYTDTYNVNNEVSFSITKPAKVQNKLTITKIDSETNKALAGAGLALYKGDCTNSECKDVYATWTTDSSAKEFTSVPVGIYTLVETKVPEGYLVASKQKVQITSDSGNYSVTMKDQKAHNKLNITKIDSETNKSLVGAGLTLYKGDCTNATCKDVYATWTSTSSAKVFNDIPVGKYTLVETSTPKGYRTAAKMLINIDSNNKTYAYSMIDVKNSTVRISKTDITGQNEIPGAKLVLTKANNEPVETWTSTTKPHYVVLAPGEYILSETVAPKGYVISSDSIYFKLDADNKLYEKNKNGEWTLTSYIKMVNEPASYKVRISKTSVTGDVEVPGASLTLKDEKGTEIKSWISTTEPHYENLYPGVYTLTEINAPKGYILSKSSITFKVDLEGNIFEKNTNNEWVKVAYIKMVNLSKEAISINKLDSETNEYVAGAKLVIKNNRGVIIASFTTAKETYYLSLEEGEYTLEEESAPKGYVLNNKPIYFKVDADANLYIKNSNDEYVAANGIIMYNEPEKIVVPATGLSSTLTYVIGTLVLGFGAVMLYRNEKQTC